MGNMLQRGMAIVPQTNTLAFPVGATPTPGCSCRCTAMPMMQPLLWVSARTPFNIQQMPLHTTSVDVCKHQCPHRMHAAGPPWSTMQVEILQCTIRKVLDKHTKKLTKRHKEAPDTNHCQWTPTQAPPTRMCPGPTTKTEVTCNCAPAKGQHAPTEHHHPWMPTQHSTCETATAMLPTLHCTLPHL